MVVQRIFVCFVAVAIWRSPTSMVHGAHGHLKIFMKDVLHLASWGNLAGTHIILAALKTIFNFGLGPPSPRGVRGEGPDYSFLQEIGGFGTIPARIREVMDF